MTDFRRFVPRLLLWTALVSLVCGATVRTELGLLPAARAEEREPGEFVLEITDQNGVPVSGSLTLELKERSVPHLFRLSASGTEQGSCQVTVCRGDQTQVRTIAPLSSGDDVTLAVYAAAGSEISFCWEVLTQDPPEGAVPPILSDLDEAGQQVCLEISETPYLTVTIPEGASLEEIAAFYGASCGDILCFNAVEEIHGGMTLAIPEPATWESYPAARQEEKAEPVGTAAVPLYFQEDYPNVRYGTGTIRNNGCSVVSLAMVANAVTGYDYAVDELADYFGGRAENNIARLELGSQALGLEFYKSENWQASLEALRQGKIVIALMDGINRECLFTTSQHFIVLTGMNAEGRILVNDANKSHYSHWRLKDGLREGFLPGDILLGYSGGWIYEPALTRQPERYRQERIIRSPERNNYPEITLTEAEQELMAKVVWAEARGECPEGQQAVAEVILNRLVSDRFSDNLQDVIYGENQFRTAPFLKDAQPGQAQYQAIDRAIYGTQVLPRQVYYFATFRTNRNVFGKIGNHIFCFAE